LLSRIPHELIDLCNPDEAFSVGDFVSLADAACRRAIAGGALPVISGGTAYYIKAFIMGLFNAPKADPVIRAAVAGELAERGNAAMLAELARVDPVSAARIAPADGYRICRALEVYRCSGRPLSAFSVPDLPRADWEVLPLGLDRPREELYGRIRLRVAAMMAAGLPAEVDGLLAAGYNRGDPGMKAIGYAEFLESPKLDPAAVAEAIVLHTRHYAKRQLTFMRSLPNVSWFNADDVDGVRRAIEDFLSC
jgi:tRNA dimethylallyltransferase